ncbi:hypothetical protein F4777DRAFT_550035 [Nemania sp. FL0916]|nr:hypothetical protein F4777DRAFT_550035 [Nemania sp. FL0916]
MRRRKLLGSSIADCRLLIAGFWLLLLARCFSLSLSLSRKGTVSTKRYLAVLTKSGASGPSLYLGFFSYFGCLGSLLLLYLWTLGRDVGRV